VQAANSGVDLLMYGGALAAFVFVFLALTFPRDNPYLRLGRECTRLEAALASERAMREELEARDERRVEDLKRKDEQYHELITMLLERQGNAQGPPSGGPEGGGR
jgi:hypothetical protein